MKVKFPTLLTRRLPNENLPVSVVCYEGRLTGGWVMGGELGVAQDCQLWVVAFGGDNGLIDAGVVRPKEFIE